MNKTLHRMWPSALLAILALQYVWIGTVAAGPDRLLGLAGGLIILAAVVVARRSAPAFLVLLVVGALPLGLATWWSIVTPALAALTVLLGWIAARHLRQPRPDVTIPDADAVRVPSELG